MFKQYVMNLRLKFVIPHSQTQLVIYVAALTLLYLLFRLTSLLI